MAERYLFKAKRTDNKEWAIGSYAYAFMPDEKSHIYGLTRENHVIVEQNGKIVLIDKDTLCQCTGLKDKNGKLIWENDIAKDLFSDVCAPIKYGSYQSCFDSTKTEHVGFYVGWSGKYTKRYRKDLGYWINMVDAEVVGNIFDNPELLKNEV